MSDELKNIKQQVFARRPVLEAIAGRYGAQSLASYIKDAWQIPATRPDPVFLSVLENQLTLLYGTALGKKAVAQLAAKALVSTIDHLGLWGHPFFVNSALLYSLYFGPGDLVITFPTESVSLNNTSSWSGCLLWHGQGLQMHRASFFTDRQKHLPVFSAPALSPADMARLQKNNPRQFDRLLEVLDIDKLQSATNFSAQACLASQKLWHAVFPSAPGLVYLPLETLVIKYLEKIFEDPGHLLSRLVLTGEGRGVWRKFFGNEHTFMFWRIDEKGRRTPLTDFAHSTTDVLKLMRNRQIYPSSPLCFAVLLYAGFACVGGFTQTTWLTQTKAKFIELLLEVANFDQTIIERIKGLPTKNFAESSLAWLKLGGKFVTPTSVDLFLSHVDYYQQYQKLAGRLTLGQSLDLALPLIYSVVVPKAEQTAELLEPDLTILEGLL